ncbi:hypothetical protein FJT64_004276 [Amphibalanus amphitrite]|uniref:Uncharacterized protein n=1 Tax=Amphibalanus amphitrite TaxID=1232801 RepID=A0A6A4W3T4_AMPAM|nr:hypothetical protein FJT64_004276 [Amphibalanus amphitrite]
MADKDLSTSEDVRRLTPAELRKLNKDQLQFALRTLINEPAEETAAGPSVVQMGRIEAKLDDMLTKWGKEKEALNKQIQELKKDRDKMAETLSHHQRMLESMDSERRAANVIMTGVPEEQLEAATTDIDKVKLVLSTIGQQNVEVKSVVRLGAQPQQQDRRPPTGGARPYRRPIKVILKNLDDRKDVLDSARRLKTSGAAFRSIYVKKDIHPLVRKEFDRLRGVAKREKDRPENQGKNVRYDHRDRKVYVDDIVIDSFQNVSL